MSHESLPKIELVGQLMSSLLGQGVTAKPSAPQAVGPGAKVLTGVYASDDGAVQVLCVCDYALAAYAGAALSMIPAGVAKDSLRGAALPEGIEENFREVLNIVTGLLNRPGAPHVKLQDMLRPADPAAPGVAGVLAKPAARLDMEITIANYGVGKASLLFS